MRKPKSFQSAQTWVSSCFIAFSRSLGVCSWRLPRLPIAVLHAEQKPTPRGNDPRSMEEFRDLALGLFIHWSVDVQYGAVISHSLVGADDDYPTTAVATKALTLLRVARGHRLEHRL